jgi:PAS domain S-box-containing protein
MAEEPTNGPKRSRRGGRAKAAADKAKAVDAKRPDVPVVGIGASAGGIEALSRFFDAMAADSGMAFVVVLHLDPTHHSELAPLLGRRTAMPVVEVADGMRIEANRVHVIVPDRSLEIRDDRLRLYEPNEPRGHRHPVDVLFTSLAEQRRERAVAIVLSGTGSNGTEGLKAIKASGGMTLAQQPETARFDGMPRSAIAAGAADHVLPPEKMPEVLLRYARHGYVAAPDGVKGAAPDGQLALDPVLALLRLRSGHDFRSYKRSTIQRRIYRRMGIGNIETLPDYADQLRTHPDEIKALVKDLMISVTGFFRDPDAWRALDETVLAPLIAERKADAEIRIWVPACATGEEAYSIAMLALERAEAERKPFDLRVFATDGQGENLNVAREGIYPAAAAETIAPERLARFFDRLDGSYQVKRALRELVVFAPQNLLRDPPFSRLDLITCRNVMIYLEPEAQKRIVALFHFALREGGHLFLGNAETVGRYDDLFETVSKKWRIFRRIGPTRHDIVDFPLLGAPGRSPPPEPTHPHADPPARAAEAARRALLERYAPASVLIDRRGRILYFHGPTGDYLEPPSGEPTYDLLAMAREGLRAQLRGAIRQAADDQRMVTFGARVRQNEAIRPISVTVAPLAAAQPGAGLLLVSFEPVAAESAAPATDVRNEDVSDRASQGALEEELKATRAELQSAVEQMESANEELKAANEEVTSMNEELQSTNEELETSKEELQSYNEELHTINNQLQHKVQELEDLANDQNNLLIGTEIATIFLDSDCRIKWFSPASETLLDLVPSDIGRPLGHFAPKFADANLLHDAEAVLATLTRIEAEVRSDAGRWYLRRLFPYRTQDNRIAGVVITFTDITERKQAADAVNEERVYAETIVETIRQPLLILDADLRVRSANRAFYRLFDAAPEETESRLVYELGNGQWNIPELRTFLEEILPAEDRHIDDYLVEHDFQTLGRRTMLLNAHRMTRQGGREDLILLAIDDISERQRAEETEQRLSAIVAFSNDAIISKDLNSIITSWNRSAERMFGYTADEAIGRSITMLIPPDRQDEENTVIASIRRGEPIDHFETVHIRKDGSHINVSLTISPVRNAAGRIVGASKVARDIDDQKQAEAHREFLIAELNHRVKNMLATVQSVASHTLRQDMSLDDFKTAFAGRLHALARAHDLLANEGWSGADIGQLVRRTLEPYRTNGDERISMSGPKLSLPPQSGVALNMILHELATNATKYGALSEPGGFLEVTWQVDGGASRDSVRLTWIEAGGPPVKPPKRRGFGTQLIERSTTYELRGKAVLDYDEDGFRALLTFPLRDPSLDRG